MRIKLFFVDFKPVKADIILRSTLVEVFQPFSRDPISHEDYLSFADMAESLNNAFTSNDMVVILSSLESYPETKDMLIRALKIPSVHHFDVYLRADEALEKYDFKSPEASVHTLLPVSAARFVPKNGLYPGFCSHKGQYVMFLPFDEDATPDILGRVSSFLTDINGGHKEKPLPEAIHADICDILANAGALVAIANTPAAKFICVQNAKIAGLHRYMRLCPKEIECEKLSPSDYIAKQAILAAKMLNSPYGIAMSNIFPTGRGSKKELKIYYAVSSKKSAKAAEIKAKKDEDIDCFLARSVNALLDLLIKSLYDENKILQKL